MKSVIRVQIKVTIDPADSGHPMVYECSKLALTKLDHIDPRVLEALTQAYVIDATEKLEAVNVAEGYTE